LEYGGTPFFISISEVGDRMDIISGQ